MNTHAPSDTGEAPTHRPSQLGTLRTASGAGVEASRVLRAAARRLELLASQRASASLAYERFSGKVLHPNADVSAWLPPVPGAGVRLVRAMLQRTVHSPLLRAEVEALLHHGWRLELLAKNGFQSELLLETASVLSLSEAPALLAQFPGSPSDATTARIECGEMLSLFAAEAGCLGQSFSPLVSEETLRQRASTPVEYQQLINTMRLFRLKSGELDPWKAEAFFPKLSRSRSQGHLYFTIGAPQITHAWSSKIDVDVVLNAQDIQKVRHPAWRRRQLVERTRGALAHGRSVLCIANHSTQASRRELISVARELGATITALFCDWPEEAIFTTVEQSEAPVARRTLTRVLETLEPPRPHEAETVLVLGPDGLLARWDSMETMEGGFVETLLKPMPSDTISELMPPELPSVDARMEPQFELTPTLDEQVLLEQWCTNLEDELWGRPPALIWASHAGSAHDAMQDPHDTADWDGMADSSDD